MTQTIFLNILADQANKLDTLLFKQCWTWGLFTAAMLVLKINFEFDIKKEMAS